MSLNEFTVRLSATGEQVTVTKNQSILEALEQAGFEAANSCRIGICGTCESRVVSGTPDHLDDLLSDAEHAANKTMLICVSRSLSPILELDIEL